MIEHTFGMIKSKAVQTSMAGVVLDRILTEGLTVNRCARVFLTHHQIMTIYASHMAQEYYPFLVRSVSGPVVIMELIGEKAVARWREVMGDTDPKRAAVNTIRHWARNEAIMADNLVHGSASAPEARWELRLMFPGIELT